MTLPPGGVWIGAQGTQSGTSAGRGIARYIAEHTSVVLKAAPQAVGSVELSPSLPLPSAFEPLLGSGVLNWREETAASGPPSIYHVTSPFEGMHPSADGEGLGLDGIWPKFARDGRARTVITLYDLIPMLMRERYLEPNPFVNATYTARLGLIRAAHQVLTISERTAIDAVELLGIPEERITVIESGVSGNLASLVSSRGESEALLKKQVRRLRQSFILYVGGDDPRKNLEGMIEAYGLLPPGLREEFQLVIVCKMQKPRRKELTEYAESRGIKNRDLVLTGFVEDDVLAALYRSCALFVFPSLYEGAGLPVLEAMSCDAPVAASRTSSIPEILGDLEATFDPADSADIAVCLSTVLQSPGELDSLRERSRARVALYTWERVAKRTLEGYERALELPADGAVSVSALPSEVPSERSGDEPRWPSLSAFGADSSDQD
jgi:glycosyltransferase involved in cell wall biosynthesis